jgi:hypothetical protein
MDPMFPLTKLQIFTIITVLVSGTLALLGYHGGLWWVATASIQICILGASIRQKINKRCDRGEAPQAQTEQPTGHKVSDPVAQSKQGP